MTLEIRPATSLALPIPTRGEWGKRVKISEDVLTEVLGQEEAEAAIYMVRESEWPRSVVGKSINLLRNFGTKPKEMERFYRESAIVQVAWMPNGYAHIESDKADRIRAELDGRLKAAGLDPSYRMPRGPKFFRKG